MALPLYHITDENVLLSNNWLAFRIIDGTMIMNCFSVSIWVSSKDPGFLSKSKDMYLELQNSVIDWCPPCLSTSCPVAAGMAQALPAPLVKDKPLK